MNIKPILNFSPDGLSGGMRPAAAVATYGQSSTPAMAGSTQTEQLNGHGDYNNHDYDDGLVHGHDWAVSSPDR